MKCLSPKPRAGDLSIGRLLVIGVRVQAEGGTLPSRRGHTYAALWQRLLLECRLLLTNVPLSCRSCLLWLVATLFASLLLLCCCAHAGHQQMPLEETDPESDELVLMKVTN